MLEKRAHKRFQASEGNIANLHDGNIGRIQNICMGGFKCNCLNSAKDENHGNVCEIFQYNMRGEHLAFSVKILSSCYILGQPSSVIPEKQCRAQFIGLNDRQRTFLADFIMKEPYSRQDLAGHDI